MRKLILLSLLALAISCNESSDDLGPDDSVNCGFNFSSITNGPNGDSISSYWKCATSGPLGVFALTDGGQGVSVMSDGQQVEYSGFEWEELGCAKASFRGHDLVTGEPFYVEGSSFSGTKASGKLTFTLKEGNLTTDVACVLDTE